MEIASLDMVAIMPLFLLLCALGCLAGFLAGLLGIGGGTVLVPGFLFIFGALGYDTPYIMHLAVGTSLAVIIATGSSSAYAHFRRGSVDRRAFIVLAPALILGVILGTFTADILSGVQLQIIFAVMLFLISLNMFRGAKVTPDDHSLRGNPVVYGATTLIGGVATIMGVGGAVLTVPLMALHGVKMQRAVGTGAALGLMVAIPGAIGFMVIGWDVNEGLPPLSFGFVNLLAWLAVIPFTVLCAPLGVAVAHKMMPAKLRRAFAIFMMILAANMAIEIWL